VVIPTFNHARFVVQAVESVLAQTYPCVEILVVDDGSTDETRAVIEPVRGRITYIYQENKGVSAARNAGIRAAKGEYLVFVDADDWIPPEKLAVQVAVLEERPGIGLVYSAWQHTDEGNRWVLDEVRPRAPGQLLETMLRHACSFFPVGSPLVRSECFKRVGLFDESLTSAEDTDMWVRLTLAGYEFAYVDRPLYRYRMVTHSLSQNLARQANDEFTMLNKVFAAVNLPPNLRALESEAYAATHYKFAGKYYECGDIAAAQDHLRRAIARCPSLAVDSNWLVEWLAAHALEPEVADPARFINVVFDHLPEEAAALGRLRRKAHGRFHAAVAFAAHQSRRPREVRHHIWPAITGDHSMLRNRGFLRIAAGSLIARGKGN